ncbi:MULTISPECIES: maleylpyruvate isomerase N-terminal domain-containing protein [unclassified Knoellia]|uniref:maleylpyruvate isomerase N-terminal domain-containing protein n=1 Tax=Knoellia altitudinis TaxID=3404795 RepID=UPI0036223513
MTDLLAAIDDHTARLVADARSADDLAAPSLCEGWTRDHVLNHVARNAEALCRLVAAAVDGTGETMYASPEARDGDIDAGVGRGAEVVVDDVEATAAPLATALRRLTPEHRDLVLERTPGGPTFKGGMLLFMRLREVVYHHVDLDTQFGFHDLAGDLQVLFIENELKRQQGAPDCPSLTLRSDEGDVWSIGDGGADIVGSRAGILRWLARQDPSGVRGESLPDLTAGL